MKVVSTIRARAEKFSKDVKNHFSDEDEKAAAKAAAEKAESEEKARAEAEAAAEEKANEVERLKREEALLVEIRDLLRNKAEK